MDGASEVNMPKGKGFLSSINTYLRRNRIGEVLVSRGQLTPAQLKEALQYQKQQNQPLGRILLLQGLVSPTQLRLALATQSALRVATAVLTILSSTSIFSTRQAVAGSSRDIPNAITLASAGSMSGGVVRGENLFGTGERASTDLSTFTKWTSMFDRFSREANTSSAQGVIKEWRAGLEHFRGQDLVDMANGVNNMMNKIRYIGDKRNWGKSDYWETPVEFLTYGGDCEDFAIAKYVSLRALGVPDNLMRLAIVKDMQKGIPHAILIVYTEDGAMVLDNQIKRMTAASDIGHYKPIFSINHTAWWLHTDRPGRDNPTQIASAAR